MLYIWPSIHTLRNVNSLRIWWPFSQYPCSALAYSVYDPQAGQDISQGFYKIEIDH